MDEYLNNDLDYVLEDHSETGNFDYFDDDEFDWDDQQGDGHGSRLENANDTTKQNSDTSASEYRNGKDMQGIPWERLNHSRDYYREMRLKMYKNYENLLGPHDELEQECKQVDHASTFYDFYYNTRLVKSTIVHFQVIKSEMDVVSEQLMDVPYGPYITNLVLASCWCTWEFNEPSKYCSAA